jgi:ubiquinone/menaquinone biosynthesis C-methylase UbiE
MNLRYIVLGLVRRALPDWALFAIMNQRGDGNGAESNPQTNLAQWEAFLAKQSVQLAGKHVLEIGGGRYARFALQLLAAGASRVTLVDLYAVSVSQPGHRALLERDCAALGLDIDNALDRIELIQADYLTLPIPPPDRRADLVISAAVLEHVYDPGLILERCYEWLKPGGFTAHMVDLRDHNMQFRYPFEMLTFSDRVWSSWLDIPGGFHLNRWRVPEYLQAAKQAGFERVSYEVTIRDAAGLETIRPRLRARFGTVPDEMLAVLSILLYGGKPSDTI